MHHFSSKSSSNTLFHMEHPLTRSVTFTTIPTFSHCFLPYLFALAQPQTSKFTNSTFHIIFSHSNLLPLSRISHTIFFSSSNPPTHSATIKPHSELLNYLISIFLSHQNNIPHSLTTTLHTTITNHTIHNTSPYHKIAQHICHHIIPHYNHSISHYILSQRKYIPPSLATTPHTTIANHSTHNTSSHHNSINHILSPQHPAPSFLTKKVHITFVHHNTPQHVLLLQNFSLHYLITTMHNTFSQHSIPHFLIINPSRKFYGQNKNAVNIYHNSNPKQLPFNKTPAPHSSTTPYSSAKQFWPIFCNYNITYHVLQSENLARFLTSNTLHKTA